MILVLLFRFIRLLLLFLALSFPRWISIRFVRSIMFVVRAVLFVYFRHKNWNRSEKTKDAHPVLIAAENKRAICLWGTLCEPYSVLDRTGLTWRRAKETLWPNRQSRVKKRRSVFCKRNTSTSPYQVNVIFQIIIRTVYKSCNLMNCGNEKSQNIYFDTRTYRTLMFIYIFDCDGHRILLFTF